MNVDCISQNTSLDRLGDFFPTSKEKLVTPVALVLASSVTRDFLQIQNLQNSCRLKKRVD